MGWSPVVASIVTGHATYTALWTLTNYTVTYDANGGTGAPVDSNNPYHVGNTVTVMGGVPTGAGYTFAGWQYGGQTYWANYTLTMPAGNITLTAQWTANPAGAPPAPAAPGAPLAALPDEEVPLAGRGIGLRNITVGYCKD